MVVKKIDHLPDRIGHLVRLSAVEGFRFLKRLVEDFESGENRFDQPGEALFAVLDKGTLLGIGGLNIDPYAETSDVGRIRRFYIDPGYRRIGLGQKLLTAMEVHAKSHFAQLRLYTDTEAAAMFYEHLGYVRVADIPRVSHLKNV